MAIPLKYQAKEVLNKVLNAGEDALNVDLSDSVTVTVDSEFPAAAALADDTSNPTTTSVASHLMGYDSSNTNWNRVEVDNAGNLVVNLSATDNAVLDAMVVDLAAMETLLTAANVDHAANEVLLGTIDADTNAIKTAVEAVNQAAEGTISATTQRVTIATDDDGVAHLATIAGAVSTQMQVDVVAISAQSDGTYIGDIKFGEALPAGSAAIGKLAANSGVDIGDVDVTSIIPGTGATNLGKEEDAVHSSGDTGVMPLAVRNDDIAAIGAADGDYAPLQVNAAGALYTNDASGEAGSILVTGTTAVTTTVTANTAFIAIQFIEDTVFDSGNDGLTSSTNQLYPSTQYTSTSVDADAGAVADSVTFPQGMTIFGRWSGFKLASGKVIAYIGYV